MGEDAGLKRIYRPEYRDPIEKSDEPELNPADVEYINLVFSFNFKTSCSPEFFKQTNKSLVC